MNFVTTLKIATVAIALSNTRIVHADIHKHKTSAAETKTHSEVGLLELKKLLKSNSVVLIDANSKTSFERGHLPGAISYAVHEKNLGNFLPQDKSSLIVVYCGGPTCSNWEEAAESASKAGYSNVKHFTAGLQGWKNSGLALE